MEREYDIFERVNGNLMWRESIVGHEEAIRKLKELGAKSTQEFIVMHLPTKTVIATINARS